MTAATTKDETTTDTIESSSNHEKQGACNGNCDDTTAAAAVGDTTIASSKRRTKNDDKIVNKYNPKKPKWWNKLANNGRHATKSQKRAIRNVLDGGSIDETTNDGLRLPKVPYGSFLDWDEVFSTANSGVDETTNETAAASKDIWLELGFGRGENLQALLESNLLKEISLMDTATLTTESSTTTTIPNKKMKNKRRRFCLVGAEVSGVGIGCLCKRIEQKLEDGNTNKDAISDYRLYQPQMEPSHNNKDHNNDDDRIGKDDTLTKTLPPATASMHNVPPNNTMDDEVALYYKERLRIHAGDGYRLLPKLPNNSLAAVLITFPDPFPKDSDVNYRFVQQETLFQCHRILRKSNNPMVAKNEDNIDDDSAGYLFLATDHDGYHEWCHATMRKVNSQHQNHNTTTAAIDAGAIAATPIAAFTSLPLFERIEPCPDRMEWLPAVSRYEQKGWDEGRTTKLSCWRAL